MQGTWGSLRHLELIQEIQPIPRNDHCYANALQRGDLSTLNWLQGPVDARKEVDVVNVQYASINFRDGMSSDLCIKRCQVSTPIASQKYIYIFTLY